MEQITVNDLLSKNLRGKIICFPTDTIYGVGALYDDEVAIDKIYQMKKRKIDKPLAILTPTSDIDKYVENISEEAQNLIDKFWPGPLTLIFKKSSIISESLTRGLSTIAFRMPNSQIALTILNQFGPMATTSVNISGSKELNTITDITASFSDYLDYLIIDKEVLTLSPSKVIDVSGNKSKIIRN